MAETPKRVLLRLDNGSLIGPATVLRGGQDPTVVRLSALEALKAGRAGEADIERLERLLQKAESVRPGHASKRPNSAAAGPPAKRQHTAAIPPDPAKLAADRRACKILLQKMYKRLNTSKAIFYPPVKEGKDAPGYYKIISEPMCLQQIETRLKCGQYDSPDAFAYDVRLVWSNCMQYNPAGNWIHNEGKSMSQWFEKQWANAGLDQSHQALLPPPTALLPPAKPEPSAAATSEYGDEDADGFRPRRSRRPRVPNRRLSSPSNEGSGDDEDGAHDTSSKDPRWSEARLATLQQQMEVLQERDSESFSDAVQKIVLADPFYHNFDYTNDELTLQFETLLPDTLTKLEADVQRRLYTAAPEAAAAPAAAEAAADAPPASMHPSPHSTQTSLQQQPEPAAATAAQPLQLPAAVAAEAASPSMTMDHKYALTQALAEMDFEKYYPQVMEILKAGGVALSEEEEYELDLEELSEAICRKLEAFAQEHLGWKYTPTAPAVPPPA